MKQEIQIDMRFTGSVTICLETDPMVYAKELRQAFYKFLQTPEAQQLAFTSTLLPEIQDVKEEAQIYGNDDEPDEDE